MTRSCWSRVALGLVPLLTGCIDAVTVDESLATASQEVKNSANGVKTQTVCFSVHNPGNPAPIAVTGTRFSKRSFNAQKPEDRVLLLLHGAVETREIFDGGKSGAGVDSSLARLLAHEGYIVVTVDRVGYGDSPYSGPGGGMALNYNGYVEMTHEIISQIHAGSYTVKDGASCGTGPTVDVGSESVVLGGHSIGGAEVMQYATRYHDIDGMISFGWTNTGAASIPTGFFTNWIIPQIFGLHRDYVTFFRPGTSGVSDDCVLGLFSQPLAATDVAPSVVNLECANGNLGTSPAGEMLGTNAIRAANLAGLGAVGATPAFLTFADLDTMVASANNPAGDPDHAALEVAQWEANCNCDVSSYIQPGSGHAMFFPNTMPELADAVLDWLESRGLDPR